MPLKIADFFNAFGQISFLLMPISMTIRMNIMLSILQNEHQILCKFDGKWAIQGHLTQRFILCSNKTDTQLHVSNILEPILGCSKILVLSYDSNSVLDLRLFLMLKGFVKT